jgi:HEAT repeat protein
MRNLSLSIFLAGLLPVFGLLARADKTTSRQPRPDASELRIHRLDEATDEDLRKELLAVPEVGLDAKSKTSNTLIILIAKAIAEGQREVQADAALNLAPRLMLQRPDLAGLPIHLGLDCRLGKEAAERLQILSRKLRALVQACIPAASRDDPRPDPGKLRSLLLDGDRQKEWLRLDAIPALQQLLMAESKPVRLVLVELLSRIGGGRATLPLVQRALFDLDPDVRAAAVRALASRPRRAYEPLLVEALRYPWPAAVNHAAEAIVALRAVQSLPQLVKLLDEPAPSAPIEVVANKKTKRKQTVVRELVRVNHLSNCLMCHAQSLDLRDLVRGAVPIPGQSLPPPVAYYDTHTGAFVRADITYLRQDFSIFQPVLKSGTWPSQQRYDYMVRLRALSKRELAVLKTRPLYADRKELTDQKKAILHTLKKLTGKDAGSVEGWKKMFMEPEMRAKQEGMEEHSLDQEVIRLRHNLLNAPAARRATLIHEYRDAKGLRYTEALAYAIPRLYGAMQKEARRALAARLTRMNAATLSGKLADESKEVRHAAIIACLKKKSRAHVPEIIPLVADTDVEVSEAAHDFLQQMTGQDFGPKAGASKAERAAAAAKWQGWWKRRDNK